MHGTVINQKQLEIKGDRGSKHTRSWFGFPLKLEKKALKIKCIIREPFAEPLPQPAQAQYTRNNFGGRSRQQIEENDFSHFRNIYVSQKNKISEWSKLKTSVSDHNAPVNVNHGPPTPGT